MHVARTLIALVALLGTVSPVAARPLVAVLDFGQAKTELDREDLILLSDVARGAALQSLGAYYDVITRENLETLLQSQGKSLAECLDGSCETDVGRAIGAELIVSGRIVKAFGAYKVNLKLHQTNPPKLLSAAMITVATPNGLEEAVRSGTLKQCDAIGGKAADPDTTLADRVVGASVDSSAPGKVMNGSQDAPSKINELAFEAQSLELKAKSLRARAEAMLKAWREMKALAANGALSTGKRVSALESFLEMLPDESPYRAEALDMIAHLTQSRRYWHTKNEWVSFMVAASADEYFGKGLLVLGLPVLKGEKLYWKILETEINPDGWIKRGTWTSTVGYHRSLDETGRIEVRTGLGLRYQSYRGPLEDYDGWNPRSNEQYGGLAFVPEVSFVLHIAHRLSWQMTLRYVFLTPPSEDLDWVPNGVLLGSAGLGF